MELFNHLEGFIIGNMKVAKTFFSLVKLEARLAGLSIFPLLLNVCFLFVILLTLWMATMVLLGLIAFVFLENSILATVIVLIANLIFVFIVIKAVQKNLRYMSFEKTRETLQQQLGGKNELTK